MKKIWLHTLLTTVITGTFLVPVVHAHQKGDILLRAGVTIVAPDDSSSHIIAGADLGLGVRVDSNAQLGINVAYFVSDKWNVELLAATPFSHDIDFGATDPLGTGNQLGVTKHLPPTLTANYYFAGSAEYFQPYVGIGLNYTVFFDEKFTNANADAGLTGLTLDDSFGLSAQIGADYIINEEVLLNASVRYIDIETDAKFNLGETAGSIATVSIDPWVYTLSIGYAF